QSLVKDGAVFLDGKMCKKPSEKVESGQEILLQIPALKNADPEPENIPLDVVYEDEDLLVLNKPVGLVVHPGAGNQDGTLVNALLHHCGDSLSGIGGVMRPGIVHRLDKDTSGLMVVAKHDKAHQGLSAQLEDRSLSRKYKALVLGVPTPLKGSVDQPLARYKGNRLKMSVHKDGKVAKTFYRAQERFSDLFSLVECQLESGRTHQIRVHMQFLKYPIIGDPLYGPQPTALEAALKKGVFSEDVRCAMRALTHQCLHAYEIKFVHPVSGEGMEFKQEPPEYFSKLLKLLSEK
ncbi:MAG: RluA family pseudouridine synthase, partial [Pseudomonadota bacterium]